ncbi:MAG: carboxymuconolactone decarboxylase family protein [Bryobacteraceae bacterium]|jgi:4-carboxymuconolactone decarboxylase
MNKLVAGFLVFGVLQCVNLTAQDRMPVIPQEKLTEAQKKAVRDYKDLRKTDLVGPPWSVILRVPDLVVPSLQLRLHNLNNSALSPKLTEFAIMIAARQWTNNYEWNAHAPLAQKAGLSAPILAAVADGRRPEHMADDEALIYDFCTELLHNQSVGDPTYARMLAKFGEAGIVEAASLEGYYTYLSMIMNTARSPLPPGVKPALAPFPK